MLYGVRIKRKIYFTFFFDDESMMETRNAEGPPTEKIFDWDGHLREAAASMLKSSGYSPVARLVCRVDQGVVELAGVVPTFHMKQVAQTVVQRVDAIKGIRNRVQVA